MARVKSTLRWFPRFMTGKRASSRRTDVGTTGIEVVAEGAALKRAFRMLQELRRNRGKHHVHEF
jgi:hypothetical protein